MSEEPVCGDPAGPGFPPLLSTQHPPRLPAITLSLAPPTLPPFFLLPLQKASLSLPVRWRVRLPRPRAPPSRLRYDDSTDTRVRPLGVSTGIPDVTSHTEEDLREKAHPRHGTVRPHTDDGGRLPIREWERAQVGGSAPSKLQKLSVSCVCVH